MRKGFTLVELIIVVIIIGVLITFALPQYMNAVERAKIGKARNAAGMIIKAEKMYAAAASDSAYTSNMTNLDQFIEMTDITGDTDWSYTITTSGGPPANAFTVTATRSGGRHATQYIVFNANGTVSSNSFVW